MRSRLLLRQQLLRDLIRTRSADTTIRHFSYNSTTFSSRPQLPFLAIPSRVSGSHQQWRRITTERIKHEVGLAMKFTVYIWTIVFFVAVGGFVVQQEWMEHRYPTPHEWTFRSRWLKRGVDAERFRTDVAIERWVLYVQMLQDVLERLENPSKDGQGLRDVKDGPPGAKDISGMSEPWRRGYVEALLLCCQAAEHVEGYVLDKTRGIVFPQDVVRGPSNPFPKPVPPGSESPPREEDCVPSGFPDPDEIYNKLLATEGLTSKQRIDATLSYANWLENKGRLAPAAVMYEGALNLAIEEIHTPGAPFLLDPKTAVLNSKAEKKPSENLLTSLTALATFKARHEDVSAALPILISILQARRNLPSKTKAADYEFQFHQPPNKSAFQKILAFIKPPDYPPPPPDGTAPPVRDSKELCEEAALHLHIGEIMYTLQSSTKEDGLAWTREGVDLAEEELHKVLEQDREDRVTKKVCRDCLASGLSNWRTMVARMAKQEDEAKAGGKKPSAGWFGLWSGNNVEEEGGRWAAEEKVVAERTRRAQDLLEDLQKPRSAFLSGLVRA
ncbi:hypothetical protein N0V82_002942 [Gnomoniopsis sp. IMI 355080]|nr:hypothetical protein N0V82_002942 [Gnomoniopsis sp. IMI 355080]